MQHIPLNFVGSFTIKICIVFIVFKYPSNHTQEMNVNADDVTAVLSPIVAGAASLARRLAASKAAANGAVMPPAVADEVPPALGPVSPLDVSFGSQKKI